MRSLDGYLKNIKKAGIEDILVSKKVCLNIQWLPPLVKKEDLYGHQRLLMFCFVKSKKNQIMIEDFVSRF